MAQPQMLFCPLASSLLNTNTPFPFNRTARNELSFYRHKTKHQGHESSLKHSLLDISKTRKALRIGLLDQERIGCTPPPRIRHPASTLSLWPVIKCPMTTRHYPQLHQPFQEKENRLLLPSNCCTFFPVVGECFLLLLGNCKELPLSLSRVGNIIFERWNGKATKGNGCNYQICWKCKPCWNPVVRSCNMLLTIKKKKLDFGCSVEKQGFQLSL